MQDEIGDFAEVALEPGAVDRGSPKRRAARHGAPQAVELWRVAEMGEVANADRAPPDLVLIGGTATARVVPILPVPWHPRAAHRGRVDLRRAEGIRDAQGLRRDLDSLLAQPLHFGAQRPGVEHDPVADHRQLPRTIPEGSSDSL